MAVPDAAFLGVSRRIDLLASAPYMGEEYRSSYGAAKPSFPCRVVYAGNYGLYYTADEASQTVYLRYVEDQRMDPKHRLTGRLGQGK